MYEMVVTCPDEPATIKVAEKLAQQLEGGEFIELAGDVGAGKTTFVKGLVKGLGAADEVTSPSFTLKNVYQGRLKVYHFDLYRLGEPGLIKHEIKELLGEKDAVIVAEWSKVAEDVLPENRITIGFSLSGKYSRKLKISYPEAKP